MELEIKMIKYEEARIELYKKVKALEETIKFLKENTYYEKSCLNCKSIMKVLITGERFQRKKFCNNKCRSTHHQKKCLTQREKIVISAREQGKTLSEIGLMLNITKQAVSSIIFRAKKKVVSL